MTDTELLSRYKRFLDNMLAGTVNETRHPVAFNHIDAGFGMHNLVSEQPFDQTATQRKAIVSGQSDTVCFGELGFQSEAADPSH